MSRLFEQKDINPIQIQRKQLEHLLHLSKNTEFGKHYRFDKILRSNFPEEAFREIIPVHDYDKIHSEWWHRCLNDESDICWPGRVRYFAMSSGTSGSPSKYIPVTRDMIRSIQSASIKQIFSLTNFSLPAETFEKGVLILGGSTHLNRRGHHFVGDMSGISATAIPFWFQHYYKPGMKIAGEQDWHKKISDIVEAAEDWDIGIVCGIPAWTQIMMESIIRHYKLKTIHDIWPNLRVYVFGGVSFAPYRKSFVRLTDRPLTLIETYIASEGYVAFQKAPDEDMTLLLNNGVYFEFIPFNSHNFYPSGDLNARAQAETLSEVEEGKPYALVMSTCAGAWRYLLGDVITFTDKQKLLIKITGRTKHYLNLCGEHLSVMNMTEAVNYAEEMLNINIEEFTTAGITDNGAFGHHWFIGTDDTIDRSKLMEVLDNQLMLLNDDYRLERNAALRRFELDVVPVDRFYSWLDKKGKTGGQHKFPRVLQKSQYEHWKQFLDDGAG